MPLVLADQDSVRLLAVEGCAALGKLLEPQDCVAHILPVIVNFSQVYWALIVWYGKKCILYPLGCWFTKFYLPKWNKKTILFNNYKRSTVELHLFQVFCCVIIALGTLSHEHMHGICVYTYRDISCLWSHFVANTMRWCLSCSIWEKERGKKNREVVVPCEIRENCTNCGCRICFDMQ